MSTKPGIFEQVKQPGKVVPSLNTNQKLSHLNFHSHERISGPSSAFKNEGRGIIFSQTTREAIRDNSDIMSSHRSNTDESDNKSQLGNLSQEAIQQQFKTVLSQWKNEIFEEVRNSLNEYNVKFNRNKETIDLIKQHLRVNTQSINEIENKLSDYDQKINELELFKMNESNPFESENAQSNTNLKHMVIIEQPNLEQQDISTTLSKYAQITDELFQNFERYKIVQAEESANQIEQLQNDLTEALENKTANIAKDFENKFESIENLIIGSKEHEEAETNKKYGEIERKIQYLQKSSKEEISNLQKKLDGFAAEFKSDQSNYSETSKFEDHKGLIDSIYAQVLGAGNKLHEMQEMVEVKIEQLESKWHEQFENFELELQNRSGDISILANRFEAAYTSREVAFKDQFGTLKKEIDRLAATQNTNSTELAEISQHLKGFKQMAIASLADLEGKIATNGTTDTKIKELELDVKSLFNSVEEVKQAISKTNLSAGLDFNSNASKYKSYLSIDKPFDKPLDKPYQNNEKVTPKAEDINSKDHIKKTSPYTSVYKSPENRYSGGAYQTASSRSFEKNSDLNSVLLNRSPNYYFNGSDTKSSASRYTKSPQIEGKENLKSSSILAAKTVSPNNSNYLAVHAGNQLQEKSQNKNITTAPDYLNDLIGDKQTHTQLASSLLPKKSPNALKITQDDVSKLRRSIDRGLPKLLSLTVGESQLQSPKINLNLHKFSDPDELTNPLDEEEQEMIYQFDENGYLMDEEGNYILDEQDQMIKFDIEQIERLRANNLLEEESN